MDGLAGINNRVYILPDHDRRRGDCPGANTNAVADRAGVGTGSLYQYFPNKESLLASLIEREVHPFISAMKQIPADLPFRAALRRVIEASIVQQVRRPELARRIDFAEK
ncbi:TetR/AcrR family transcriptional regulator [Acidisarcina polymorpha]|nr:TetR/AcrR family transcriptional regulator [Acidisarcina polymorpha]